MKFFTLLLISFLSFETAFAAHYFVHPHGQGSGSSWADASSDLAAILAHARSGDEVWVAGGTYTPSKNGDRQASFILREGVRVYGGFSGLETERTQRDWGKYPTILSGEIGEPGIDDNSFNVVFSENVSNLTVLDGFIITAGNASGEAPKGGRIRGGGGWHDRASDGGISSPYIANCTFLGNRALEGGGFFAGGSNGSSNPIFRNCRFLGNFAKVDGGAIYSDGRSGSTNHLQLFNCTFQDNMSTYGAGIYVENGNDVTGLTAERCVFKKNNAFLWGGGIYYGPSNGHFELEILDCIFEENYPTDVNKRNFLSEPVRDVAKK
jgi:predicted outer membrane repeat protein